ncbi:MAG: T9SS type A sorting domain-containing protein [Bacteroidia bacterium]
MRILLLTAFISLFHFAFPQCNEEVKTIWSRNDTAFVGANDTLFRTLDGGTSWDIMTLADFKVGLKIREIEVIGNTVYAISLSGTHRVFKGENWGNTWKEISNGTKKISGNSLLTVRSATSTRDKVYMGGGYGLKSFNESSQMWEEEIAPGILNSVRYLGGDTIWASVNSSTQYSHDGGDTWTAIEKEPKYVSGSVTVGMSIYDIVKMGSRIIIAGSLKNQVLFKTDDYGKTWDNITSSQEKIEAQSGGSGKKFFKVSDDLLFFAEERKVWKTTDKGNTWTEVFAVGDTVTIRTIEGWKNDKVLVGSTHGFFELDNFGTGSATQLCIGPSSTNSIQSLISSRKIDLYPNPVNSTLHVNLNEDYSVYNQRGILVENNDSSVLDVTLYSSGIYYLKTASGISIKFMVK